MRARAHTLSLSPPTRNPPPHTHTNTSPTLHFLPLSLTIRKMSLQEGITQTSSPSCGRRCGGSLHGCAADCIKICTDTSADSAVSSPIVASASCCQRSTPSLRASGVLSSQIMLTGKALAVTNNYRARDPYWNGIHSKSRIRSQSHQRHIQVVYQTSRDTAYKAWHEARTRHMLGMLLARAPSPEWS